MDGEGMAAVMVGREVGPWNAHCDGDSGGS